jgi:hypothetical protein|tara:strand:+ start:153 stop:434 length:282 start_codon:yes stop_codon:yes gene_type:complete
MDTKLLIILQSLHNDDAMLILCLQMLQLFISIGNIEMKYGVIKCRNAGISDYVKNFNKRLEDFLNNGWVLHGTLQVVVTSNEFVQYHQAIIKL